VKWPNIPDGLRAIFRKLTALDRRGKVAVAKAACYVAETMTRRRRPGSFLLGSAAAAVAVLGAAGCSSSSPRDQYYNTDAGADYHPSQTDAGTDGAADAATASDPDATTSDLSPTDTNVTPAPDAADVDGATSSDGSVG
jgi:hypothetical protein